MKVQRLCVDENIGAQHSLIVKTTIIIIKQLIEKDSVKMATVKQGQNCTEREIYKDSEINKKL